MTEATKEVQGPEARYFAELDQGRFRIQQCTACERHVFYPRTLCPHCGAEDLAWVEPSGHATVYSVSVIPGKPGTGTDRHVAIMGLEEGVRLMSRVDGVSPDNVRIGMSVEARVKVSEGKGLLIFVPSGGPL